MTFGIDFGTTNSAVVFNNSVRLDIAGDHPFPSVVAVDEMSGRVYTGMEAIALDGQPGYHVVRSVKRFLESGSLFNVGNDAFHPKRLVTELFRGLRNHVAQNLDRTRNQSMDEAVVSIPVGFKASRRQLLREAALDAGLKITGFVSEPTAAYLHCRRDLSEFGRVAVFDWGGGTLDVSVIRVEGKRVYELAKDSREEAGIDIDKTIAEWVHANLFANRPSAPPFDRVDRHEQNVLLSKCEDAKCRFSESTVDRALINVPRYAGEQNISIPLTRAKLDELTAPFVDRAVGLLEDTIASAREHMGLTDIDRVLLIGGSSQLTALEESLHRAFPGKLHVPDNRAWPVAYGASWLSKAPGADKLGQTVALVLSDGTPLTLVQPEEAFGLTKHIYHLSIVDGTDNAQLVFAELTDGLDGHMQTRPKYQQVGNLDVPMNGTLFEQLNLSAQLTPDLTLEIIAISANGIEKDERRWEYPKLRCYYEVSR